MRRSWRWVAIIAMCAGIAACDEGQRGREARILVGGDPSTGRTLVKDFGCGSCHTIPGVRGATAKVGPPLTGIAARAYIAGVLPNNPDNLQRWLLDPPAVDSQTAMPNVHMNPAQARHIATYLYTLR